MALAWPLVGRQEELDLIGRAMDRPDGSVVVIAGGPGVGKTRLAREALAVAEAKGLTARWAVATGSAGSIPFGAVAHLLPAEIPARPARSNLLRTMAEVVLSRAPPGNLVLGVDDAHLLDPSSAALLHHLAVTGQAFLLSTIRTAEPLPDAVAGLWKDDLALRLEVQDLSRPEMEELVERVLGAQVEGGTRQQLWELTRGNPLFLKEVVQAGIEVGTLAQTAGVWQWTGPIAGPRLIEIVEARVGGLPPAERAALELVAIGEPLERAILEAVVAPDAAEALEREGLLEESVDGKRALVRLSHPLYAEVLRAATPPARARAVHRMLAEALQGAGSRRREDILRLATWHLEAGITDRPEILAAAAQRALGLFDHALAERLATAACEAGGGFQAGVTLASALIWQGRFEEAEALLSRVEADGRTEAQRAETAVMRANNLMWQLDRGEQALLVLDAALDTVHESASRDVIAAAKAYLLAVSGRTDEAMQIGLAVLNRAGVPDRALPYAYGAAGHGLLYTGRPREALALMEHHLPALLGVIDETPFGPASMGLSFHRYLAAVFSGRFIEAAELSERSYREAVEHGIEWWTGTWAAAVGWSCLMQGKPRTSIRWLREAIALLRQVNIFGHLPIALAALAHGLALTGDAEGSEQTLAEADATSRVSQPGTQSYASLARPWALVARGELSGAIAVAIEEATFLESMNLRVFQAIVLHDVARLGQPTRVVAPLSRLAGECEGPLVLTLADHAAALSEANAGALDQVSHEFEELGAMLHAAEAAAEASAAHRAQGMKARAAAATARARALASRCEGARTPALGELDHPEVLTRREKEVTALAARHLSNREIAGRLGVSVRTVDNHLHSAYAKLEVSGREELAQIFGTSGRIE